MTYFTTWKERAGYGYSVWKDGDMISRSGYIVGGSGMYRTRAEAERAGQRETAFYMTVTFMEVQS